MEEPKYAIKATQTSFEILELVQEEGGLTTTEITREVGLAKSAVHKHLQTLTNLGYLTREGYQYYLGLRCFTLGIASQNRHSLYTIARSEVDKLAKATSEEVRLFVIEDGVGYYIYKHSAGNQKGNGESDRKTIDPYQSTAGHAISKRDPEKNYSADADALLKDKVIHEQEITFSFGTLEEGKNCVSAPITGIDNRPVGALEVVGAEQRTSGKRLKEDLAGLVLSTVASVERRLRE